ncbi:MAG: polymorphic toxin-type HINT domain-containing protein [Anaerolineae bacterium]
MLVRTAAHADDVTDALKVVNAADDVLDAAHAVDNTLEAGHALDNLAEIANVADDIPCSFSAQTDVATLEGAKDIAAVEVGDYVLAWNEADGTLGYYEVTATFSHADQVLTELIIDGEWLETTPEHPFYVEGKGWVEAEDLRFGDRVRQADGTTGIVWLKWDVHKTETMYNLTVDTAHTYFVGEGQWLVHNACPVKPYDVGPIHDLKARSNIGDNLDLHHVPQSHPASQIIPGYTPSTAPAIALPERLHENIPTMRGTYLGTARELLARDIWNLRSIGVPNSALQALIDLNKKTYPWAFMK